MNPQEAFLDLLLAAMKDAAMKDAAMKDAALSRKLTQLQTQFDPTEGTVPGAKLKVVRIVVIPDELDHQWPRYAPAGTPTKGN